jgi:hypothetical protein
LKNGEKSMTHEEAKKRRAKISELMRGAYGLPCMTRPQARAIVDALKMVSDTITRQPLIIHSRSEQTTEQTASKTLEQTNTPNPISQ